MLIWNKMEKIMNKTTWKSTIFFSFRNLIYNAKTTITNYGPCLLSFFWFNLQLGVIKFNIQCIHKVSSERPPNYTSTWLSWKYIVYQDKALEFIHHIWNSLIRNSFIILLANIKVCWGFNRITINWYKNM